MAVLKKYDFKTLAYSERTASGPDHEPWKLKLFPRLYYQHSIKVMKQSIAQAEADESLMMEMKNYFQYKLGVEADKILYTDHHLCHAASTAFFMANPSQKTLIFTLQ